MHAHHILESVFVADMHACTIGEYAVTNFGRFAACMTELLLLMCLTFIVFSGVAIEKGHRNS